LREMIIFIYGEDSFRSRRKLKELKDKFLAKVDPTGASLDIIDGEKASLANIGDAAGAGTLLAKKRMVVIENLFSNKAQSVFDQVLNYFEKRESDNIIVFWDFVVKIKKIRSKEQAVKIDSSGSEKPLPAYSKKLFNFLAKQKYSQQFNVLSNTDAAAWAKKEVEARGGKIDYQAVQTLTSLVGSDLWQINNEIDKLINYKLGQQPALTGAGGQAAIINQEDVEKMTHGGFDENIFALTDAISNKNSSLALKLLEEQIEAGLADAYLMTMIIRQFRILLQIRQALDLGHSSRKIISSLRMHPFIVQKGINQVRRFNLPALKNIFSRLAEIDSQIKTGQADAKTMLNLLFARI